MLTIRTTLPDGFLEASSGGLHQILPGPTLIHLPGRNPRPVFVSILLHGNEDTGLKAVQRVLATAASSGLPRALSIFIGNVQAAAAGLRRLDAQPDYNRVWPGADTACLPEHGMTQQVVQEMRARNVFASIDIHNNTGLNPHYACVNRLDQPFLHLATLFSRIVVYFERPLGVQSAAFAGLCPAVTVECGKPGNAEGEREAARLVEAALHLDHFPAHAVAKHDLDLYHTVATVKVSDTVSITFHSESADVRFVTDLERMNFTELAPGTHFADVAPGCTTPLHVSDPRGEPVTARYFALRGGELRTILRVMPAMLTRDERVIRQDCLCYLMERLPYPDRVVTAPSRN
jgi:succinylglutamate desuccinylase